MRSLRVMEGPHQCTWKETLTPPLLIQLSPLLVATLNHPQWLNRRMGRRRQVFQPWLTRWFTRACVAGRPAHSGRRRVTRSAAIRACRHDDDANNSRRRRALGSSRAGPRRPHKGPSLIRGQLVRTRTEPVSCPEVSAPVSRCRLSLSRQPEPPRLREFGVGTAGDPESPLIRESTA